MQAITLGYQEIATGNMDCVLVGGTESMSRVPYYLEGGRWGYRLGHQDLVDGMYRDGFSCPLCKLVMGETAEVLAEQYKINRDEQDQFPLRHQQKAENRIKSGRFKDEIAPITLESKKSTEIMTQDEHPFLGATLEKMSKLAPVFSKLGGVTAGNSSGITDGAAALVLASDEFIKKNNVKPMVRVSAVTSAGVDPRTMGVGPVPALKKMEKKYGLKLQDFDLI